MQRREKLLLFGLLAAAFIWLSSGFVSSVIFEPFQKQSADLADLQASVSKLGDEQLALAQYRSSLKKWLASSFPLDPGKTSANNAQRLYLQWLTDLAELCEFDGLKVEAGPQPLTPNAYMSVVVKIDAEARYEQLVRFLDLFYRTDLMHRISQLNVSTKVNDGDPKLTIKIEAEGLVLLDAPPRRSLFPQTTLDADLSDDAKILQVSKSDEFPKKAGFRVQIKNEFLKVTEIDGTKWTVERAVEQTRPAKYAKDAVVELVRFNPKQSERTLEEFREMVATNIFVKPLPPYKMKLAPIAEKAFARGKPIEFSIAGAAQGYDTLKGKPQFAIADEAPAGLTLDKSGKVTWKPAPDVLPGKYFLDFEVRHASAPQGSLTGSVTIRLREGNVAKLKPAKPSRVFLNREWKFQPELMPTETTAPKYTWKLGDRAPQGLKIDEKSGELKWTPGDATTIGETTVSLIVTDSESPPQSTTLSLKLDVQDDAAQFTRLTGIIAVGDKKRVFVKNQSVDKETELHEGDKFAASDVSGTIKLIGGKYVILSIGEQEIRWSLGQSLREAKDQIKDY